MVLALIDSRCTRTAMDAKWVWAMGVKLHKYLTPIPVFNVDRSPNKSEHITYYAKILIQMGDYVGQINVAVSNLEHWLLIPRHDWLWKYNLDINWCENFINFNKEYVTEEDNKFFSINRLFTGPKDETLYMLNLATYLWAQETKANTITSEEFTKAFNRAKKASLSA